MKMKNVFILFILSLIILVQEAALACEMCTIPRIGRQENMVIDSDKKWFTHFLFEKQDWDAYGAEEAHELHHDGHHIHNKTREYFYHVGVGRNINEHLSLTLDMPWAVRESLGIEHDNLGVKEKSEGIGDLNLIGAYEIYHQNNRAVRLLSGVKFPTGETDETNSLGERFEPELQPGSGSYDFILGGVFEQQLDRIILKGNSTYTIKTEGEQQYEFGDVFSTSVFTDYVVNPDNENFIVKAGIDTNYQYSSKDKEEGVKQEDSGGHTLLTGPSLTLAGTNGMSVYTNFLFPVWQDLGGLHQELDYAWTAGGKIMF
ncbi:MAG: transporter [Candidatus Omnitrophica bacterium]|nr:transporter [Candidatus Omnitrophota bacterium]